MSATFTFDAEVWLWEGDAAWHFASLPTDVTDAIDDAFAHQAKGFGSQRVAVTIGATTWQTSVFPSKQEATFILPVKKAVRTAEGLEAGSTATITVTVLET
ncbi:MAG: DUF1905 domain-containing protein [Acidimicrobiales bacterium]|nr:DUF1905 domain-containing protein [Acidimicrobiales bacterium]